MTGRIDRQIDLADAGLKKNAPSTRARKMAQGKPPLSLIDEGVLRKAAGWRIEHPSLGVVTIRPPVQREKVFKWLRPMGYGPSFGVSERARRAKVLALKEALKAAILDVFNNRR